MISTSITLNIFPSGTSWKNFRGIRGHMDDHGIVRSKNTCLMSIVESTKGESRGQRIVQQIIYSIDRTYFTPFHVKINSKQRCLVVFPRK